MAVPSYNTALPSLRQQWVLHWASVLRKFQNYDLLICSMKIKLDQTTSRFVSWTKVNLVVPLPTCCQSATLLHMLVGEQPAALDQQQQQPGVWPHVTSARLNLLNADGNIYGPYLDSQQGDTQQIYRSKLAATVVGVGQAPDVAAAADRHTGRNLSEKIA